MQSLRDLSLMCISKQPTQCLRGEDDKVHGALVAGATGEFVRCAEATGLPATGTKSAWADCWSGAAWYMSNCAL